MNTNNDSVIAVAVVRRYDSTKTRPARWCVRVDGGRAVTSFDYVYSGSSGAVHASRVALALPPFSGGRWRFERVARVGASSWVVLWSSVDRG